MHDHVSKISFVTGALLFHDLLKMIFILVSTFDVWCCVFFFANRIGTAASSGDKVQISQHTQYIVRVPFFVAGAVLGEVPSRMECYALESVFSLSASARLRGVPCCVGLPFTWQARYLVKLHARDEENSLTTLLNTVRFPTPLHTLHSTLHTLHSTLYTPHSTLPTLHPHSTL